MLKFALAGNPNSGKTTLFNVLTGSSARVGNWTGVTVEKREGVYEKLGEEIAIVDLPGIYSLSPYSPEERVARNFLLNDAPDCIINVVDVTNLERNLYLSTQLMELGIPMVIALNMMDELDKKGDRLNVRGLERTLGLPMAEICALKGEGVTLLMEKAKRACEVPTRAQSVLKSFPFYAEIEKRVKTGDKFPLFHAVKRMEGEGEDGYVETDGVERIADARYTYVTKFCSPYLVKATRSAKPCFAERVDNLLTHKIWGIPIFLAVMLGIFYFTFGRFSLGGALAMLVNKGTEWVRQGIVSLDFNQAFTDFLGNGIWGGISAVLGFLPQMLLLFLCFSLLEDVGYMARVAFMLDKIFRPFGVSGRALLPMLMGFGCSVPAMISARTLSSETERERTVRVIPFFFCGAKMPVLLTLTALLSEGYGVKSPALVVFFFYLFGVAVAFCSLFVMNKISQKPSPPFIMELPAFRPPSVKNLSALLFEKAKHFLQKAFTIIALSCVVVWGLSHFSYNLTYVGERVENGLLALLGKAMQPIFTPLGWGKNLNGYGWVFAVATLAGVVAKEDIVAVLTSLALCLTGSEGLLGLFMATGVELPALLAFISFNLLTVPCISALVTAAGELGRRGFFKAISFWLVVSYALSWILYLLSGLLL